MTLAAGTRWRWLAFWGVLLVAAFGAGRVSSPAEVERVTEYQIISQTKSRAKVSTKARAATVVYVDRYVSPEGAVSEKIERREVETKTMDTDRLDESRTDTAFKSKEIVKSQPSWSVGVLAGATWKEPALRLGDTPLVVGATVDFRIPKTSTWVGAWGTTQGAGGLALKVEF